MKIKDWEEAIDLTIELHQAVLDGKSSTYDAIKLDMKPREWHYPCPLCEYSSYLNKDQICNQCIWTKFTTRACLYRQKYNFKDDKESIERLNEWKQKLKADH